MKPKDCQRLATSETSNISKPWLAGVNHDRHHETGIGVCSICWQCRDRHVPEQTLGGDMLCRVSVETLVGDSERAVAVAVEVRMLIALYVVMMMMMK